VEAERAVDDEDVTSRVRDVGDEGTEHDRTNLDQLLARQGSTERG